MESCCNGCAQWICEQTPSPSQPANIVSLSNPKLFSLSAKRTSSSSQTKSVTENSFCTTVKFVLPIQDDWSKGSELRNQRKD
ncbi:hypothetical protein QL285_075466 [Trifolium repens]|nr:hypothetical protein QL285_075466 [Trifolium repens]